MNPLDQLAPLIAPPPIGWWPSTPGWWLLATLLPLLGWGLWRLCRHLPRRTIATRDGAPLDPLREATLAELTALAKPYDKASAGPWLQAIDGLLKRACRACWPDSSNHALSDRTWLAFLDNRCLATGLTRWMILVEGGRHADCTLDDRTADGLDAAIATWIRKHV